MSSSSESGVSDSLDPMAIVSDDEIATDPKVFTSDTTSSDDDDFQPFALPDFGDGIPIADGFHDGDLLLVPIPAPFPLAAFPLEDLPLDDMSDDDIDLLIEGPPKDAQDGGDPVDDDVAIPFAEIPVDDDVVIPLVEIPVADIIVVPLVEIPAVEISSDHSGPDSFDSVSSVTLQARGVQHYPTDTDSDIAISATPIFPHDFDPDHEIEFVPDEQPFEAPVIPDDQLFDIPADFEYAPANPEPEIAPEAIPAHNPLPVHDPLPVDVPVVAPPFPDPLPAPTDHAPFATHVDPRYAHTHNGWIEDDDDYPPFVRPVTPPSAPVHAPIDIAQFYPHESDMHRTDLPVTFLQDIHPPVPGKDHRASRPVTYLLCQ
ncbi:calphotin-like [Helianthus annuus]|uniref:calphotin-like n=1 Tax=Helianthus annuus TaxID=4232 RepID=UPI000B8FF33B|nr:calphotin-like [Helianthus annuus]